jgi:hypothetical protein
LRIENPVLERGPFFGSWRLQFEIDGSIFGHRHGFESKSKLCDDRVREIREVKMRLHLKSELCLVWVSCQSVQKIEAPGFVGDSDIHRGCQMLL